MEIETEVADACVRSKPWFDDGNLIYRGLLCESSTVFKDMFGLPQLVPGCDLVEGCPVVSLSDTASDLQHVLMALYHRG
jgi:hypothetical protein